MKIRLAALVLSALLPAPGTAFAQQGFVGGLAGVTFGTETGSERVSLAESCSVLRLSLHVIDRRMEPPGLSDSPCSA
jgi:hypothetical protein